MTSPKNLYFHPQHGIALGKQGFCWPAFFFGSLWAVARRAYPVFFILVPIEFVFWFLAGYAEAQRAWGLAPMGLLGTLIFVIVRGWRGNRWMQSSLLSRGYALRGTDD